MLNHDHLRCLLTALPVRFRWTLHNVVAHPLMELLYQLGFKGASNCVHDATAPLSDPVNQHPPVVR